MLLNTFALCQLCLCPSFHFIRQILDIRIKRSCPQCCRVAFRGNIWNPCFEYEIGPWYRILKWKYAQFRIKKEERSMLCTPPRDSIVLGFGASDVSCHKRPTCCIGQDISPVRCMVVKTLSFSLKIWNVFRSGSAVFALKPLWRQKIAFFYLSPIISCNKTNKITDKFHGKCLLVNWNWALTIHLVWKKCFFPSSMKSSFSWKKRKEWIETDEVRCQ